MRHGSPRAAQESGGDSPRGRHSSRVDVWGISALTSSGNDIADTNTVEQYTHTVPIPILRSCSACAHSPMVSGVREEGGRVSQHIPCSEG